MSLEDIYNLSRYKEAVKKGIASGGWNDLQSWFVESAYLDESDSFPQSALYEILRLLESRNFLEADGSHNVLRYLQHDWDLLSVNQQESLLVPFEKAFPQFWDGLSKILIIEMISEQYNKAALKLLKKILKSCRDDEYGTVLMGIYKIAKDGSTVELRNDAKIFFTTLAKDTSSSLADTAVQLLRKLGSD